MVRTSPVVVGLCLALCGLGGLAACSSPGFGELAPARRTIAQVAPHLALTIDNRGGGFGDSRLTAVALAPGLRAAGVEVMTPLLTSGRNGTKGRWKTIRAGFGSRALSKGVPYRREGVTHVVGIDASAAKGGGRALEVELRTPEGAVLWSTKDTYPDAPAMLAAAASLGRKLVREALRRAVPSTAQQGEVETWPSASEYKDLRTLLSRRQLSRKGLSELDTLEGRTRSSFVTAIAGVLLGRELFGTSPVAAFVREASDRHWASVRAKQALQEDGAKGKRTREQARVQAVSLVADLDQARPGDFAWERAIDRLRNASVLKRFPRGESLLRRDLPLGTDEEIIAAVGATPALASQVDAAGYTLLHDAADRGLEGRAAELLSVGAQVSARDRLGQTPLHRASWRGHERLVAGLLAAGAPVDARDAHAHTPLHRAAWGGHEAAVRRLLAAGARVNARSELKETALIMAAAMGHAHVLDELLDAGATQEASDGQIRSALVRAVQNRHSKAVRVLLDHTRPPTAPHIFDVARDLPGRKRTSLLKLLAKALGKGERLDRLLWRSARTGALSDVEAVLAVGANPLAEVTGTYALEQAVRSKKEDIVRLLAPLGADKVGAAPRNLALLLAVRDGWARGVELLLELGADKAARDREGRPAAVVATRSWSANVPTTVALLRRLGFDLNALDRKGLAALHHAANRRRRGLDALLAAGADVNVKASDGTRPFWFAARRNSREVAKKLLDKGARPGLHGASWYGDASLLEAALAADPAGINKGDRRGMPPLFWAILGAQPNAARLLLRKGADPNKVEAKERNTALHIAAYKQDAAMVKLLLKSGAKTDLANIDGRTPADIWPEGFKRKRGRVRDGKGGRRGKKKGKRKVGSMAMGGPRLGRGLSDRSKDFARGREGGAGFSGRGPRSEAVFRRRNVNLDLLDIRKGREPLRDLGHIDAEVALARELVSGGHYRAAERVYNDLLAIMARSGGKNDKRRFAALNNLGRVLTFRGALGAAGQALGRARAGLAKRVSAVKMPKRPHQGASKWAKRRWLQRVQKLRAKNHRARFRVSVAATNLAHVRAAEGRTNDAITGYRAVLKERLQFKRALWTAATLEDLGLALLEAGQYREAEQRLSRAFELVRSSFRGMAASVALNLGVLRRTLGDTVGAKKAFEQALLFAAAQAKRRDGDPGLLATALVNRADLYRDEGKRIRAGKGYRKALALLEREFGGEHELVPPALLGLAAASGDADRSGVLRRARAAVTRIHGAEHPLMARVMAAEARQMVDHDTAIERLREAVFTADLGGWASLQWSTREALAARLVQAGRRRSAIFVLKQAVSMLETLRGGTSARWRQRFVEDKAPVYRQLAGLLVDEGRLAEAQQTLRLLKREELGRFTLRSASAKGAAPTMGAKEQAVEQKFTKLRAQMATLARERADLRLARGAGPLTEIQRARLKELRRSLRVARKAFDAQLDGLEGELKSEGREQRSLRSLRALQGTLARLDKEAVAIHYVVTAEHVHILLTGSEVQLAAKTAVTKVALNRKVAALRQAVLDPDSEPQAAAKALYDLLLKPIAQDLAKLGAKTLLIAPDGVLRYVPFAALHDGSRYLVERFRPVVFTEASRDKLGAGVGKPKNVAGLGVSAKLGAFSALPSVPKELHGIVLSGGVDADGVLPGIVKLDKEFQVDSLRDALDEGYAVLHLATHFELRPGTAKDSFLLLGDGSHLSLDTIKYDDFDFRDVDMLTLSACNTGMGLSAGVNDGKEVEGFAALAQSLGARSVIATLWPVADESTGLFMQNFYKLRASQPEVNKAEAMRRIQVKLLRGALRSAEHPDIDKPFAHPFFWAPFVLLGNWL